MSAPVRFEDNQSMLFSRKKQNEGLFKSVVMAYSILGFHVVLLAAIVLLVIFFRGLVSYMFWIFLFVVAVAGIAGYLFYRRARKRGLALKQMLDDPVFAGRMVEISFLGGFASVRLGRSSLPEGRLPGPDEHVKRLEDGKSARIRELEDLARLLEENIITDEEFQRAKQRLLKLD